MTSAPTNPLDVPPYQLQPLISNLVENIGRSSGAAVEVLCARALGPEVYVGCSNGELLRFSLQARQDAAETYTLLSRQSLPGDRPVNEIILIPSISRALVHSGDHVFFYTLPALDIVPANHIKPMRNVFGIAVDEQQLRRSPPSATDPPIPIDPVEFCIIKRGAIALYSLRDRLFYQKEVPLPSDITLRPPSPGVTFARRTGKYLCIADRENYNILDLEAASMFPLLPLSQDPDNTVTVKPFITVVAPNEFLILSWTGATTLGVFITGDGEPVRGTLEWPSHPEAVCLDYPYITTLLPNGNIEIHSIETQAIVQVISALPNSPSTSPTLTDRKTLIACANGFIIPSTQRSEKLRRVPVRLVRGSGVKEKKDIALAPEEIEDTEVVI